MFFVRFVGFLPVEFVFFAVILYFCDMKIAVVTSGILPVPAVEGGAVEHLTEYFLKANELNGQHEVTVYSVAPHKPVCVDSFEHTRFRFVNVTSFWSRVRRVLFCKYHKCYYYHPYVEYFLARIISHIKRADYDVIILENRPAFAVQLRKVTRARILTHLHTDTINPSQPMALEWLNAMDGVIAISDYIRRQVLSVKPDMPVSIAYNGIDLEHFEDAEPISRVQLGFHEDDFVMVYCGRVIPEKGIEQVIKALLQLSHHKQLKMLVIGSSFYGSDKHLDAYVAKMQQLSEPVKDRIHFTGYVAYDKVASYLKACDVAVLPSLCEEAFGLTMLESMACGLPVITTNAGGIPEVCEGSSVVLQRDDALVDQIVQTIELWLNDKACYNDVKQKALQRSQHFSLHNYTYAMSEALEQLER